MNRADFPMLENNPSLNYLDSANTTFKPRSVISRVDEYYNKYSVNIGRATYSLSEKATAAYENSRQKVAKFIGAKTSEVVFTYSATYGINQVAVGLAGELKPDDVILLSDFEHNSNILVWQKIAYETGAKVAYLSDDFLKSKVKIFSFTLTSNLTGEVFDHQDLITELKNQAYIVIDAAQAISKFPVDVKKLNCDFLVFSAHKLYAPSGVGVLYINTEIADKLTPLLYGSQTIESVTRASFRLLQSPQKFEPGTPNIEGAIGLGAAIDYLNLKGMENLKHHDDSLVRFTIKETKALGLEKFMVNLPKNQVGVFSFSHPRIHPHDFALLLDSENIAVRAGKVCSDTVLQKLGLNRGVVRISFGIYTTTNEIRDFLMAYKKIVERLDG